MKTKTTQYLTRTVENHPNLNNGLVILFKVLTAYSPHSRRDALCAMTSPVQYNARGVFRGSSWGSLTTHGRLVYYNILPEVDKEVQELGSILGSDSVDLDCQIVVLTNNRRWVQICSTTFMF